MMSEAKLIPWCIAVYILMLGGCTEQIITPNQFKGNDIQRIRSAIEAARIENISIIGIGDVILKGANNPRATGDGARTLALNPAAEKEKGTAAIL